MAVRIYTRTMHEVTRFPVMAVIDADKGTLITTVVICNGPTAAAYDPARKLVFASRGGRTMSLGLLTHSVHQMASSTVRCPSRRRPMAVQCGRP